MMNGPLHPLEKRLLKALEQKRMCTIEEVSNESGLSLDQTRRAVEWLKSKDMLQISVDRVKKVSLDIEGVKALDKGLPERRLVDKLMQLGGETTLENLKNSFDTSFQEFSVAFGNSKRRGWITVQTVNGQQLIKLGKAEETTDEEQLLKKLLESKNIETLGKTDILTLSNLKKRPQFITIKEKTITKISITRKGLETTRTIDSVEDLNALTPSLLATGKWKGHALRPINVESPPPPIYSGKKHPVQRFIDEVREIFVVLGFEEIDGPIIQPSFWNFDALFIPQDHPAREMQDTFYISNLKLDIIDDEESVKKVSKVHQDGWETGSTGWGYNWSLDKSKEMVLRTHTTAVTVKYLAEFKPNEKRVFSVGRVFRNEKTSFKHLDEFHQIEGIAVGEKVSLRDLMGLLSSFYSKLGLKKVKFWPTFFPYTEPSIQSMVYFENLGKWVELCGMGILRPEVTLPLGVKNPVLAWGGGLERLVMLRHNIVDIRDLYSNNIGWLRRLPLCQ